VPADQPAPEAAAASTPQRSKTAATGTRAPRTSAAAAKQVKRVTADAGPAGTAPAARKKAPAKTATKGTRAKPTISPSPGTGEGAVLTAVADDGAAVAVVDAGTEGLKLDETVVAGPDGVAVEPEAEEVAAEGGDFEWDDEEESEALRQAR